MGTTSNTSAGRLSPALARLRTVLAVVLGAGLLRLLAGVGFANYDTLYALVWGQQLSRGETPQYGIPVAPTPHPLIEALGLVLSPLGPGAMEQIVVALGFIALAACGWVVYRLGEQWFGRPEGALAALILLTRVDVLSYGVRAYVDVPYIALVLTAMLVESRRRRAGAPVIALLSVAGLLRPEAWAFTALYWLYLRPWQTPARGVRLAALAATAPVLWMGSDLLVTGNPLWSLTNTRHTATLLDRVTGIANVPEYIPRRVGEILRPPVLLGAAIGGVLSLAWLRDRARFGAIVGMIAVAVFALFATVGLPINTRYAFLTSAILCIFCGAGALGWRRLPVGDRRRRWWAAGGAVVLLALLAYIPSQISAVRGQLTTGPDNLAIQQRIQDDLVALVSSGAIGTHCGPIGVPNHAPIPLLALRLKVRPSDIVSAAAQRITRGTYVDAANALVSTDYILDPKDPKVAAAQVPAGFKLTARNRSWKIYERCVG